MTIGTDGGEQTYGQQEIGEGKEELERRYYSIFPMESWPKIPVYVRAYVYEYVCTYLLTKHPHFFSLPLLQSTVPFYQYYNLLVNHPCTLPVLLHLSLPFSPPHLFFSYFPSFPSLSFPTFSSTFVSLFHLLSACTLFVDFSIFVIAEMSTWKTRKYSYLYHSNAFLSLFND